MIFTRDVLLGHGTAAQRSLLLRPLLRADEAWCQLFREPSACIDLASLATRAERDGEEFVVNGQKVWTSNAHVCDDAILLVRTDPGVPKNRGITLAARSPRRVSRPSRSSRRLSHRVGPQA